tara:strand:- start:7992 stop:8237 length:246 start_codon:yes stop_codon:yes gene_type:complete
MGKSNAPYKNCVDVGKKHHMIHEFGGTCACGNCGLHCGENPQLTHEQVVNMTTSEVIAQNVMRQIPCNELSRFVDNPFRVR